eukprot:7817426-Pyramimonas_sp.AAC.2
MRSPFEPGKSAFWLSAFQCANIHVEPIFPIYQPCQTNDYLQHRQWLTGFLRAGNVRIFDEEELGKLRNLWDNDQWRRREDTSDGTSRPGDAGGAPATFDPRPYRPNLQKWDPMRPYDPPKMAPTGPPHQV